MWVTGGKQKRTDCSVLAVQSFVHSVHDLRLWGDMLCLYLGKTLSHQMAVFIAHKSSITAPIPRAENNLHPLQLK